MHLSINPNLTFKALPVKRDDFDEDSRPTIRQKRPKARQEDEKQKVNIKDIRRTYREGIGDVSKFFAGTSELGKSFVKALAYGAITEAFMLTANWLFKSIPRAATGKAKMTLWQTIKHPLRSISKAGKWASASAAVFVAGYHVTRGFLNRNQKTANIDHQLNIGHRDK